MTWLWPDKARINARRIELGLSQEALGKHAKVGKTTIERLLGRGSRRATHTTLSRIAKVLDLPLAEILLKVPSQDGP
ncbi:MAG: helix-turn-helix transcriptional regulator, partial [Chromatiales bacterium]